MEDFIQILTGQIRSKKAREMVAREIRAHIEDQACAYKDQGMEEAEAMKKAVDEMGDPVEVGVSMDRLHRPRMAWGVAGFVAAIGIISIFLHMAVNFSGEEQRAAQVIFQAVFTLAGFLAMLLVCWMDYSVIGANAKTAGVLLLGSLLLLRFFMGYEINGAARWISFMGKQISLVPFAYLYVPVYGALLYQYRGEKWQGILKSFLWMAMAGIIVSFMGSLGQGVMLLGMMAVLLSVAVWKGWFQVKGHKNLVAVFWGIALIAVICFIFCLYYTENPSRFGLYRIRVFLFGTEDEKRNWNYILYQIKDLLGGCRLWGAGRADMEEILAYGVSPYENYMLVFLAASFGIFPAAALTGAVLFLVLGILRIAVKQKNEMGMMMSLGCGLVFFCLTMVYCMANAALLPVTFGAFPFFGTGGSELAVFYLLMGIVLSVYRYKDILPGEMDRKGWRIKISFSLEK